MDMSTIFVAFHWLFSIFGGISNLVLCYVAIFKSPKVIRVYSIITANFAATDFLICLVNGFNQMRMIPLDKTMIFVSYGPCRWFSSRICFNFYSILVHLYTHTIWLLLLSFSYRYYVMVHSEPTKLKVKILLILIYIPSFITMILLFFDYTDPSELLEILSPEYDLQGLMYYGIADSTSFNAMFSIIHVAVMSTPIVVCIVVLRKRILGKMQFKGMEIHENTRKLQLQLLKALTFQAIIPFFYLIGVANYFICRLEIYRNPISEYLIFSAFLFVPVLTPISSFIFVTPYRKFILRIFKKSNSVEVVETREETRETRVRTG